MIRRLDLALAWAAVLVAGGGCVPPAPLSPTPAAPAGLSEPAITGPAAPVSSGPPAAPLAGPPPTTVSAPRHLAAVPLPPRKPHPPAPKQAAAISGAPVALPSAALSSRGPPDALIGLNPAAATALLGPPAETEEHPPATVWRYRAGGCSLELVFYLDGRTGRLRSIRDDLRGTGGDAEKRKTCLQAIAAAGHVAAPH